VRHHHRSANAQAQASTAAKAFMSSGPVGAKKSLERQGRILGSHAVPRVAHPQYDLSVSLRCETDFNTTVAWSELERVVDQIIDDLTQVMRISRDDHPRFHQHVQLNLARVGHRLKHLAGPRNDGPEITGVTAGTQSFVLGLGQEQELVHEHFQRRAFLEDAGQQIVRLRLRAVAVQRDLDRRANRRQRRAQLVRRIRQEISMVR